MLDRLDSLVAAHQPGFKKIRPILEPHHLLTAYAHPKQGEQVYFAQVDVAAHLHTSEEVISSALRKYGSALLPMQLHKIDRNFQTVTYLMQTRKNILTLQKFCEIENSCGEAFEPLLLFSLIELIASLHGDGKNNIPQIRLNQIGLDKEEKLCLCDHNFYFAEEKRQEKSEQSSSLIHNLTCLFRQIFQSNNEKLESTKGSFNSEVKEVKPKINKYFECSELNQFVQDVLSEKVIQDSFLKRVEQIKARFIEENTTITSSFVESPEESGSVGKRSFRSNPKISFRDEIMKPKKPSKISRKTKVFFLVISIILVAVAGYFCTQFFTRQISCREGEYVGDKNQCLSCTAGCLRCQNGQQSKCLSCVSTMYLVLNEEEDKEGKCLKECDGKRIKSNYCVANKKQIGQKEDKELMSSFQ